MPVARTRPVALTIAGSDSGGGAGVVADLKTFEAHGVWGTVAITSVTAQNTLGVERVAVLDPAMVRAQIDSVLCDIGADAIKTGMLGGAGVVAAVADRLRGCTAAVVVDPVLASSSGARLLDDDGVSVVRDRLLPLAAVVTPNLAEAAVLTGLTVADRPQMAAAGRALVELGCGAALVTGGHLSGARVADCLIVGAEEPVWIEAAWVGGGRTHGTGCVLSAAITARLATGWALADACTAAAAFVRAAIIGGVDLGTGQGCVDPTASELPLREGCPPSPGGAERG